MLIIYNIKIRLQHPLKTNILCISEYEMPPDFKCVWEKQVTSSLKVHEHISRTEKLFMLHPEKLHTFKGSDKYKEA